MLAILLFIGTPELIFIFFIALLIFGPEKIPELAKNLGKGIRILRDTSREVKNEIIRESVAKDIKKDLTENIEEEVKQVRKIMNINEEIPDMTPKIKGTVKRKP